MLSAKKREELLIKEKKLKEICRENLRTKKNYKYVWVHIRNKSDLENHVN